MQPSSDLAEALVLSSVLRAGHALTGERFGLARCPPASSLFAGHPAVERLAAPPPGAPVLRADGWKHGLVPGSSPGARPFAKLSLAVFGRELPEEPPWAPVSDADREALRSLPFTASPVLLAPGAGTALERWPDTHWAELAERLAPLLEAPLVWVGHQRVRGPPGLLNISGTLMPRELVALVGRSQACIGVDPFLGAAAQMHQVPALSLFGQFSPELVGFEGQLRVHALCRCGFACTGGAAGLGPRQACPQAWPCLTEILPDTVFGLFEAHLAPKVRKVSLLPPAAGQT